jgi:hypothetical protein
LSLVSHPKNTRYHVAPPRPYDDWLRGSSSNGLAPWHQQKTNRQSSGNRSAPLLGKLGKLVLPPVAVETAAAGVHAAITATRATAAWTFKGGARPTASIRVLSAKRKISAGMRELQSELMRVDRVSEIKHDLNQLAAIAYSTF